MSTLGLAYAGISAVVENLTDDELLLPTGCRGWSVADLLLHLTVDAQRALIGVHTPSTAESDVDAVTYWKPQGSGDPAAHGQWVRRSAAAFTRPGGVVGQWLVTAAAAGHAAATADPDLRIATQGHVLTVADFRTTLITEAALHHLDLIVSLPDAPEPDPAVEAVALSTVEGLAGPPGLPAHWSTREALRKAGGRAELNTADRQALGPRAELFPLIS